MRYLSLFSGIEACTVAWHPLGWEAVAFAEFDDFPKAVLKYHYPNVPDLGDVTKITAEDLEKLGPFELLVGGSPCFGKGTLILTKNGLKPIESVEVGTEVWTKEGRWQKVLRIGHKEAETVVLRATGMPDTVVTLNHPYWSRQRKWVCTHDKHFRTFLEPSWTEVGELTRDSFLATPMFHKEENPRGLTADECWLIGRYIADGHYRDESRGDSETHRQYQLIISVGEKKLASFEERMANLSHSCYPHSDSVFRCVFGSMKLVKLIEELGVGKGAENKEITPELLCLPKELLKEVVEGYLSGDGCTIGKKISASTVSQKLAVSLVIALGKVYGIGCGINKVEMPKKTIICGREVNQKDFYQVRCQVGAKRHISFCDEFVWNQVRETKPNGVTTVYNLEVDEDHSYIANGVVVHNCQDLSVAGKRAGLRNEDGSLTRSGLFDHQMRIFELAREINGCRFCLWENVPGALSSNDGQDFAYVLGTMVQGSVSVPRDGWANSGVCLSGDGRRCVEWRILDAQHMGVPQRRRRLFLISDSGTWWSRPPILFEPKGVSGNFESCGEASEGFTGCAYAGSDPNSKGLFADIIRTSIPREDESEEDEEY